MSISFNYTTRNIVSAINFAKVTDLRSGRCSKNIYPVSSSTTPMSKTIEPSESQDEEGFLINFYFLKNFLSIYTAIFSPHKSRFLLNKIYFKILIIIFSYSQ